MKMIYYRSVKTIIDITDQVEVIINIVIRYHNYSKLIISNQGLLFNSKF